jgi:hypothetical protein
MPHTCRSRYPSGPAQLGGYLPLATGVSTVRYPIPQRTFKYVATVQSVTDETCQHRKCAPSHHPPPRSCALPFHVLGKREVGERGESRANHEGVNIQLARSQKT